MNIAIATVTTSSFQKGTLVLIHSFLKRNTWFKGDILIFQDKLDKAVQGYLSHFPNLKFFEINNQLMERVENLKGTDLNFDSKYIRFLSIESFIHSEYDKILFLDSDMLCLGNIESIFNSNENFSACPDFRNLLGFVRDPISFKAINASSIDTSANFYFPSFNTGFMMIGKKYLNQDSYMELCDAITYQRYKNIITHQTDTVVLNLKFKDEVHWLDYSFNAYSKYLYNQEPELSLKALSEMKFVHFLGKEKPWIHQNNPSNFPFHRELIELWIENYTEAMESAKVG